MIKFTNKIKTFVLTLLVICCTSITPLLKANAEALNNDKSKILYKEKVASVAVFNCNNQEIALTDSDIHLMAQVVYAESCGEPYNGKIAVASVILNRVVNNKFPKSIEGVIKQKGAFSCVRNGKIAVAPNNVCYSAVYDALNGKDPTNDALFFYNPEIATCKWMKNVTKNNIKTIGNHVFFHVN